MRTCRLTLTVACLLLAAAACAHDGPHTHDHAPPVPAASVSSLIGDHMVLQRGMSLPIRGTAAPGTRVLVTLDGIERTSVARRSGDWKVMLPPQQAGGPHTLSIAIGYDEPRTYHDVLVGDVWVCSGQSNMQWPVSRSDDAEAEIAAAEHPEIRLFTVTPHPSAAEAQSRVDGEWVRCSPQTVGDFSAAGYYFGRAIQAETGVPIGLIDNAWGGMPAEAYTSRQALLAEPTLAPLVEQYDEVVKDYPEAQAAYEAKLAAWEAERSANNTERDPKASDWEEPGYDDSAWASMVLPDHWEQQGLEINGAVWFRKTVDVPASLAGRPATLSLGPIDDFDVTFLNGQQIGATGPDDARAWQTPRVYEVPAGLLKPGANVVAVRVFDSGGGGGIYGDAEQLRLSSADGTTAVSLAGDWKYAVERAVPESEAKPRPRQPLGPDSPRAPAALYNGMTVPLADLPITGVIWYQGESNADRAYQYRTLFPVMIRDWRRLWERDDLPFLYVQLANFLAAQTDPDERNPWPELREAQLMALDLPNTAMAVTIDVGDAVSIHPTDKQTVGRRLARAALAIVYDRDIVYSGPIYRAMKVEGDTIRLSFDHVGQGLTSRGEKLTGFAIAGDDQVFHWAHAAIEGDSVVVRSDAVSAPVAVRYGWANNPPANLYNEEGLPASPFRTDDWDMVTNRDPSDE